MPKDSEGIIWLSLFTACDIYLQNMYICLLLQHWCVNIENKNILCVNSVSAESSEKEILMMFDPLHCQIYVVAIGKPSLYAFVFRWIKNANVHVRVFIYFFYVLNNCCSISSVLSIYCVTFFSSFSCSLLIFWHDALFFFLPLNISRCANANMKSWTPGTTEQRVELLSAFIAEGNNSLFYAATQFIYLSLEFTESILIHVKAFVYCAIYILFSLALYIIGLASFLILCCISCALFLLLSAREASFCFAIPLCQQLDFFGAL